MCSMQKGLPLRRGSAIGLPRESRMLLDDVIAHRCHDFAMLRHRAGAVGESMAATKLGAEIPLKTAANTLGMSTRAPGIEDKTAICHDLKCDDHGLKPAHRKKKHV